MGSFWSPCSLLQLLSANQSSRPQHWTKIARKPSWFSKDVSVLAKNLARQPEFSWIRFWTRLVALVHLTTLIIIIYWKIVNLLYLSYRKLFLEFRNDHWMTKRVKSGLYPIVPFSKYSAFTTHPTVNSAMWIGEISQHSQHRLLHYKLVVAFSYN